ncbi:MAG: hypothetical protein NTZ78_01335 [Candidatus Aureabacteria bacterium]|nr:hypothetical protein [Candidatus Auribacterota bacterium]
MAKPLAAQRRSVLVQHFLILGASDMESPCARRYHAMQHDAMLQRTEART